MFKLATDPRVYPFREVDLSGANSSVAAVPSLSDLASRDLAFERPDGGKNIVFRARRGKIDVSLSLVDSEVARDCYALAGLTAANRQRAAVLVAPNLGPDTLLYAPLSRSLRYWRRNVATGKLEIASPSTSTLTGTRYAIAEDGFLEPVAAGFARFEPSRVGRALRVEYNPPNLISPSHPAIGVPIWTSGGAAPTVAFDGSLESIVRGRLGATRVTSTSFAVPSQWFVGFSGASQFGYLYAGQWLRGSVLVSMGLQEGAAGYGFAPAVQLDPRRWTFVAHRLFTTATSTSFSILNSATGPGGHFEIEQGPVVAFQTPASDFTVRNAISWNELGVAAPERITLGPIRFPREHTFSFVGRVPSSAQSNATVVDLAGGAGGDSRVYWDTNGLRFRLEGFANTSPLSVPQWQEFAGRPYAFVSRLDSGLGTWKTTLAIYRADRTIFRVEGLQTTASAANAEDITSLDLGQEGGLAGSAWGGDALIGQVRLDRRPLSDSETTLLVDFLLSDAWTNLRVTTEGKLFSITGLRSSQLEGRWFDGEIAISLEETDAIEDGALAFAI